MLNTYNDFSLYVLIPVCIIIMTIILRRRSSNRSIWVRKWIEKRQQNGVYHQLLKELCEEDHRSYRNFLRMDRESFEQLVVRIRPFIERKLTNFRAPISVEERLAITLRFLATGI